MTYESPYYGWIVPYAWQEPDCGQFDEDEESESAYIPDELPDDDFIFD